MHIHVHESSVDDDGADSLVDQFGLGGHAAPLSVETTLVMTNSCRDDGGDCGEEVSYGGSRGGVEVS